MHLLEVKAREEGDWRMWREATERVKEVRSSGLAETPDSSPSKRVLSSSAHDLYSNCSNSSEGQGKEEKQARTGKGG